MFDVVRRLIIVGPGYIGEAISAVFRSEEAVLEEAERYLSVRPLDIVMLVELEIARCEHCGLWIIEKAGWIVHKWIHLNSGAHLCHLKKTQATPTRRNT